MLCTSRVNAGTPPADAPTTTMRAGNRLPSMKFTRPGSTLSTTPGQPGTSGVITGKNGHVSPDGPEPEEARRNSRGTVLIVSSRPMLDSIREIRARGYLVVGPVNAWALPRRQDATAADVALFDLTQRSVRKGTLVHLCRAIAPPLIVITEADDVESRIEALHAGVSDHIVAPFDMSELIARIDTLMARRRRARRTQALVQVGELTVDEERREASRGAQRVALTATELIMLLEFTRNAEHVVSKRMLSDVVWPGEPHSDNAVEVHVSAVRRKLKSIGAEPIHTVHGVGYVLRPGAVTKRLSLAALVAERDRLLQERDDALARRDALLSALRRLAPRG